MAAAKGLDTLFITIPLIVILTIILIGFTSTLNTVFQAALFHFAATGESPKYFDEKLLRAAYRPRRNWFV